MTSKLLTASHHVSELIATCARSLYAIRTLQSYCLLGHAPPSVFKATVQARLLYCSPACRGSGYGADAVCNRFYGAASDWVTATLIPSQ